MECHLLEQMAFVTGYDVLFESTFNSNDHFKNAFIEKTSEKVYYALQDAIDCILGCEEQIAKLTNKITDNLSDKAIKNINKKISNLKEKISLTFMRTQNLIVSSYFDKAFNEVFDLEGLDVYRRKLEAFKHLICTTDGYFFFDNYYIEKMCALEHRCNILENGGIETAPVPTKTNKISAFFRRIKESFSKKDNTLEF